MEKLRNLRRIQNHLKELSQSKLMPKSKRNDLEWVEGLGERVRKMLQQK